MESISPVLQEEHVANERVIALDQEQYIPIIVLPIKYEDGTLGMMVRFRLSDQERAAIAAGADLVVTELTFGRPFTPIHIELMS